MFFYTLKEDFPLRQKGQDSPLIWVSYRSKQAAPLATSLQRGKKQLDALFLSKDRRMETRKMRKETANQRSASGNSTISAE